MRIIKNNYKYKQETLAEEYICENCNSVFEYEDGDIITDNDNTEFVKCPCCGHKCITYTPPTIETKIFLPSVFGSLSITALPPSISKNRRITSTPIDACAC